MGGPESLSVGTRAFIYGTPLVCLLLFTGGFVWIFTLQRTVDKMNCAATEKHAPSDHRVDGDRERRQVVSSTAIEVIENIAKEQLKILRATCEPNGTLCIEGYKGDIGPVGEKGEQGDKGDTGSVGPLGRRGPQGLMGMKGSKGDLGPRGMPGGSSVVVNPPHFILKPKETMDIIAGQTAEFVCEVVGYPQPTVKWRKEQGEIPTKAIISAISRSKLTIENVDVSDSGVYICVAENLFGTKEAKSRLTVRAEKPKIVGNESSSIRTLPSSVQLNCQSEGIPEPVITWSYKGKVLPSSNGTMTVAAYSPDSDGEYLCRAENIVGSDTRSTTVKVYPGKEPSELEVEREDKTVIQCTLCSYTEGTVTWRRDNSYETGNKMDSADCALEINSAQPEDSGNYSCVAVSSNSSMTFVETTFLNVYEKAVITFTSTNNVVLVGETATLRCCAKGLPEPEIVWTKDSKALKFARDSNCVIHTISNASIGSGGTYNCHASNAYHVAENSTFVAITEKPEITLIVGNDDFALGRSAKLICFAEGELTPTVEWTKEGTQLATGHGNATWVVDRVSHDNGGKYVCEASNKYSNVSRSVVVEVKVSSNITSITKNIKTDFGTEFTLNCCASGTPKLSVVWTNEKGKELNRASGCATYVVSSATYEHEGKYTCRALNRYGNDSRVTTVDITRVMFEADEVNLVKRSSWSTDCVPTTNNSRVVWVLPSCYECNVHLLPRAKDLGNGTLRISRARIFDTAYYVCVEHINGEKIKRRTVFVNVENQPTIDEWMLRDDECGGFRQSSTHPNVSFAVSKSNTQPAQTNVFACPPGYNWASSKEGRKIFGNDTSVEGGEKVYSSQCGWEGLSFQGRERRYFRFRDSFKTSAAKFADSVDQHRVRYSDSTVKYAGIVCVKQTY